MSPRRSQERVDEFEAQVKYLQTQPGQLMEKEKEVIYPFVLNGEGHYQENGDAVFDLPPVFDDYSDETFELEGQEDYSRPSPLVLDHHLHKGIACVAHFAPCYDNFIIPLSSQLEPELAELITMGGKWETQVRDNQEG